VPDAIFSDPRLAAVYDAFDGDRDDLDAYVAIADELRANLVLDVGCGTGSLAIRLAATGRRVVGVDPADASLNVARAKDRLAGVGVTWIHGDATAVPALGADLAVMTGNVAQVFITDEAWAQTLRAIARTLRPGGHFVFETRRPERQAWLEWAADTDPVTLDVPGIGQVTQRLEVTDVALPLVAFRYAYHFASDGEILTSASTLRFRSRDEVKAGLAENGFHLEEVREAPDRPGREFVFIAEVP